MTTFALSVGNTKVWGPGTDAALALALVYGGAVQILAGMWEFVRKNTFGALAFSSFGAFWIAYYVVSKFIAPTVKPADLPVAAGVFLLGWTIFTFYMTIPSLRVSGAVAAVFVLLTATFILLTIGAFQSSADLTKAGGWVGVATAAAAWYASFAGVVNETFKRPNRSPSSRFPSPGVVERDRGLVAPPALNELRPVPIDLLRSRFVSGVVRGMPRTEIGSVDTVSSGPADHWPGTIPCRHDLRHPRPARLAIGRDPSAQLRPLRLGAAPAWPPCRRFRRLRRACSTCTPISALGPPVG